MLTVDFTGMCLQHVTWGCSGSRDDVLHEHYWSNTFCFVRQNFFDSKVLAPQWDSVKTIKLCIAVILYNLKTLEKIA